MAGKKKTNVTIFKKGKEDSRTYTLVILALCPRKVMEQLPLEDIS